MSEKEVKKNEEQEEQPEEQTELEVDEKQVEETVETQEAEASPEELLQVKVEELEDQYLRARAEIANITNRNRNEREQLQKYRSQDLAKKLIPAIDNLERAMATEVADEQGRSLKKGVEMTLESLRHAIKEEGIEEIMPAGEAFDPNLHQAVQTIPAGDDAAPDTVVEVLQKGYKLHDRVLRPAMVIVAQ